MSRGARRKGGARPRARDSPPSSPPSRFLVIDLGFVIEPREDETLPEAVLGTARLSRMDVSRAPIIKAAAGDMVLGGGKTHVGEEEEAAAKGS